DPREADEARVVRGPQTDGRREGRALFLRRRGGGGSRHVVSFRKEKFRCATRRNQDRQAFYRTAVLLLLRGLGGRGGLVVVAKGELQHTIWRDRSDRAWR